MSQRIAKNKVVSVTYQVHDEQGLLLERYDFPVSYVHGVDSELFEKIEQALEGRTVGDTVQVTLTPAEGFGEHRPELTFTDDLDNVPHEYRRIGAEVMFQNDRGETITMTVTRIRDGKLTVDGNHPFAGKTVVFTVKVEDVRDATPQELAEAREGASRRPTRH